jgi:hypothetical protein
MSPYITYRENDEMGNLQYFILQTQFPNYVCMLSTYPMDSIIEPVQITGYSLWLIFQGTLSGRLIPNIRNIDKEIYAIMESMSQWYYANRIVPNHKKYRKFIR